ncbi:hypothetical protein DPEC_G00147730 [Dallia pectoralis]|uniref:Uncharacterized protein n=1 Tax=Dallia pectoralis TaxID=75939 RepID=A0ACC2GIR8_DALPE|nr:hypothetical protein DPEC_G00147730 [Dallia pectoralis]
MEWREQTSVSCADAFTEAQRWMEEVTKRTFGSTNFRSALENGVLLCDLINHLKPGVIKRTNRLSTPIAGLDNINVFLGACGELGLNEAQLFHPGDLQDVSTRATLRGSESNRRLKNVLITIYWLGRKAQADCLFSGPQLNLKAFEGLLGIALSKALEEAPRGGSVRDSGYSELWYPEREEEPSAQTQKHPPSYRREDSVESLDSAGSFDSLGSRTLSCISDSSFVSNSTMRASSDGCSSDVEAEHCFVMADGRDSGQGDGSSHYRRRPEDQVKSCTPSQLTRSKSMNDITPRLSAMHVLRQGSDGDRKLIPRPVSQERLERCQARVTDSEAKWHNDLTKWKLKRRMSNSDLRRKMQQRDNMGLMTNARVVTVGTFRSLLQDGDLDSPGNRSYKAVATKTVTPAINTLCSSSTITKEGSLELRPQTRGLLMRGFAVESHNPPEASGPLSTSHSVALQTPPEPLILGEQSPITVLLSDGAGGISTTPTSASPFISQTQSHARSISSPSLMVTTGQDQNTNMSPNTTRETLPNGSESCSASATTHSSAHRTSVSMDGSENQKSQQHQQLPLYRYSSRAPGDRGPGGVSASLPRGYRRAESSSSCLSAGFTPRPFAAKPSRVSSLPGLYNSYLSEDSTLNRKCSPPDVARPRKQVTISEAAVTAQPWVPANQSIGNQDVKKEGRSQSSILKTRGSGPATHHCSSDSLTPAQKTSSEMYHSDLRVSLSMQPHRPDQSFITHWNATGINSVQSGQPGTDRDTSKTTATAVNSSQADSQAASGLAVTSLNGGFHDDPEPVRSKGGSVSAISDLQVPGLSSSSSWSWDPEEEMRRQQRWQEEQERQLQEKYRRDQERLDAEWQQAQKEAALVGYSQAEVQPSNGIMGNGGTQISSAELNNGHRPIRMQPSPPTQVASNQKKEVASERRDRPGVEEVESSPEREEPEDVWSGDSYAFTQLSAADRLKSKSTSSLVSLHEDKLEDETSDVPRMKFGQSMSPAEVERQQILEEMRKRTALLTDSSWIRQRAASSREALNRSSSMRRYESMDNLHHPTTSNTSSTSSNPRSHSSLGFSSQRLPSSRHSLAGVYGGFSGGYSSGTQKHSPTWSRPSCTSSPTWSNLGPEPPTAESRSSSQQHSSILSTRQVCSVCGHPLGRGAAMVIQALGLCFHLACFQCADCRCHLGGYELRTQIRIRSTKPYCDPCYIRRKSHFATPL